MNLHGAIICFTQHIQPLPPHSFPFLSTVDLALCTVSFLLDLQKNEKGKHLHIIN